MERDKHVRRNMTLEDDSVESVFSDHLAGNVTGAAAIESDGILSEGESSAEEAPKKIIKIVKKKSKKVEKKEKKKGATIKINITTKK